MTEAIIVAIIGGVFTLTGVLISNFISSSRREVVQDEKLAQIRTDIQRLEKKQDAHNQIIERTYALEDRANRTDDELKRINRRLERVEEKKGA